MIQDSLLKMKAKNLFITIIATFLFSSFTSFAMSQEPDYSDSLNRLFFTIPEKAQKHIQVGDIKPGFNKIGGGIHTEKALDDYKNQYKNLYTQKLKSHKVKAIKDFDSNFHDPENVLIEKNREVLHNGVIRVKLNPFYFNKNAISSMTSWSKSNPHVTSYEIGGKTLFPSTWNEGDIESAIYEVMESNVWTNLGSETHTGIFDGVQISVSCHNGTIISAYPTWEQP